MTTNHEARYFRDLYNRSFLTDAAAPSERVLHVAYELGREAVASQLSLLDLTHIHHKVLASRLEGCTHHEIRTVVDSADEFFLQTLSAYEMIQRGFSEAQRELQSEREHADQLRRLAESSLAVDSSLSIEDMLKAVTDHSRRIIDADCCLAGVTVSDAHIAGTTVSHSAESKRWDYLKGNEVVSKIASAAMLLDEPLKFTEQDPPVELADIVKADSSASHLLLAPLRRSGHHCVGFILLANVAGGFTDKDESIVIQLAQTVSAAVDNAVLYARQRGVAETLQRGLLPKEVPDVPGLAIAAGYFPGAAGLNVGGDWYDVVRLPRGRTGLVIGDVVGRGVRAASVMGQTRTAFRAYSIDGSPPQVVIAQLNRLMSVLDPDHFSTVAYLVWDPARKRAQTVIAGHPPPLLIDPSGVPRYLNGDGSVPLGTLENFPYRSVDTPVEVGATLIMYTDGLVEHGGELGDGLEDLAGIASRHSGTPRELCDRILTSMLPENPNDDVAVVVVRFLS